MSLPLQVGPQLPEEDWSSVRLRTILQDCKWDPQSEDRSVLAPFPLLIRSAEWERICKQAEQLAAEALRAEQEIQYRPELMAKLGLPRRVRECLAKNGEPPSAQAARVMRFDFHLTTEGWRISEVNADVPGGFIEGGGFTEKMVCRYPGTAAPPNPGRVYCQAIRRAVGDNAHVALVHATAHSDDRQVMQYLARIFTGSRIHTTFIGPAHLRWDSGRARIVCSFAEGFPDVIVRFFPAEWLPRLRESSRWHPHFRGSRTPLSNPGSSLLLQSKRFALVWDDLATPLPTWRALLPETHCPSQVRDLTSGGWVLKPALGRVGEDVGIRGVTPDKTWSRIVFGARCQPSAWVAQRRFELVALVNCTSRIYPCLGIFTVDGRAAGVYGRAARKPLVDHEAQDIAILIEPSEVAS